ncbi:OmpA family protein [Tabrizicola sp. WMC-M-20]|nr:OmpA family protein [Tabrizicola sp. WMC-M-20]
MSMSNYHMTTALVASLVLGLPQNALAQDAGAVGTVMLCQDKSAPPCPAGEPAEGTAMPAAEAPAVDPAAREDKAGDAATPAAEPAAEPEVTPDITAGPAAAADGAAATSADATAPEAKDASDTPAVDAPADITDAPDASLSVDTTATAGAQAEGDAPAAAASADAQPTDVSEDTVDAAEARSSEQEFGTQIDGSPVGGEASAQATATADKDDGLTNFEKALLLGLGAVAVGSLLDDGGKVVSNTGDRVVVDRDGRLVVYKDDDALLFREGTNVRTETFADGSKRTFLKRSDGSQIVTIRDAEGRVLRRTRVAADGTEVRLFDDTVQAEAIELDRLGTYNRIESIAFSSADEAALRAALQTESEADRRYSLRQIRDYEEVRSLVPSIDLDTINFATGSAAIPAGQIEDLRSVGTTMEAMLTTNPGEVFLIEGHTDAVGDAASNLALSDRRAETVALALTESFAIPPENLVVQGYGAQNLKIDTAAAEQANRRATVRRITPLLKTAAAN